MGSVFVQVRCSAIWTLAWCRKRTPRFLFSVEGRPVSVDSITAITWNSSDAVNNICIIQIPLFPEGGGIHEFRRRTGHIWDAHDPLFGSVVSPSHRLCAIRQSSSDGYCQIGNADRQVFRSYISEMNSGCRMEPEVLSQPQPVRPLSQADIRNLPVSLSCSDAPIALEVGGVPIQ